MVLVGLRHIFLQPPLKGTVSPYRVQNVSPWRVYCKEISLETLTKDLEQILKNRAQMCLEPKKRCLNLSRAVYKGFRAGSQKWFPEVSKTLSKDISLKTLTKDLEHILKNRVQMCLEPKKVFRTL